MRVILPLVVLASFVATTGAFTSLLANSMSKQPKRSTTTFRQLSVECDDSQCDLPDLDTDFGASGVASVADRGASVFRNSVLTDADGNKVRLGDRMGSGKSVVIFLRHLG